MEFEVQITLLLIFQQKSLPDHNLTYLACQYFGSLMDIALDACICVLFNHQILFDTIMIRFLGALAGDIIGDIKGNIKIIP